MFDSRVTPNQSWAWIRNICLCLSSQSSSPTALITVESFAFVIYSLFSTVSHIFLFRLSNMSHHVGNNQTHSHHSIIYVSWNKPVPAPYHRAGLSENSYVGTSKATHRSPQLRTHSQSVTLHVMKMANHLSFNVNTSWSNLAVKFSALTESWLFLLSEVNQLELDLQGRLPLCQIHVFVKQSLSQRVNPNPPASLLVNVSKLLLSPRCRGSTYLHFSTNSVHKTISEPQLCSPCIWNNTQRHLVVPLSACPRTRSQFIWVFCAIIQPWLFFKHNCVRKLYLTCQVFSLWRMSFKDKKLRKVRPTVKICWKAPRSLEGETPPWCANERASSSRVITLQPGCS